MNYRIPHIVGPPVKLPPLEHFFLILISTSGSTGRFSGTLDSVKSPASVQDDTFDLKSHKVGPLHTNCSMVNIHFGGPTIRGLR